MKKLLCMLIAMNLVISTTIFATANIAPLSTAKVSFVQNEKTTTMVDKLKSMYDDETVINSLILNFAYLEDEHNLSNSEMEYIADLIINGCDGKSIIEIAYFWIDTNEEITIIKQIYDILPEYQYSKYAIENAFNKVTNYKCGVLEVEDVENYLKKGITSEDISMANKLCRKGVYTIQEILDMKLKGWSFEYIHNDICGNIQDEKRRQFSGEQFMNFSNAISSISIDEGLAEVSAKQLVKKLLIPRMQSNFEKYVYGELYKFGYTENQIISKVRQEDSLTELLINARRASTTLLK